MMRGGESAVGRLWIVGTPIGHPDDITVRALAVLRDVSLVATEDTRRASWLLRHFDIHVPLVSCHGHNEAERVDRVLALLGAGQDVAYVSDAGTPSVSDPGSLLVRAVSAAGFPVIAVPGVSAVTTAISISGMPARGYHFLGFLPRSDSKRTGELRKMILSSLPIVVFESPRRIGDLLRTARAVLGDRDAVLCRELTKDHEEVLRGRLSAIAERIGSAPRGEMTLVIAGASSEIGADHAEEQQPVQEIAVRAAELLRQGLTRPQVARALVKETGSTLTRSQAYELLVRLGDPGQVVRFEVVGHPNVRATHDKTIELKRAKAVSARETCVVGVGGSWDMRELKGLRGHVEVTIVPSGDNPPAEHFEANISPSFSSADRIVFRRSGYQCTSTLGTHATKGASDLDRSVIAHLKQADARAEIVIRALHAGEYRAEPEREDAS